MPACLPELRQALQGQPPTRAPRGLGRLPGRLIFIMSELSLEGFIHIKRFLKIVRIFKNNIYVVKNLGNWLVFFKLPISACVSSFLLQNSQVLSL